MALSAKEIIDSPVADGPAGFGMHRDAVGEATVSGNVVSVDLTINKQSHASAMAQNDGGVNKPFSAALKRAEQRVADGQAAYQGFLGRSGANKTMARMGQHGLVAARQQLRTMHQTSPTQNTNVDGPAPPRMRLPRELHVLRQTMDLAKKHFMQRRTELAAIPATKKMAINPTMLPASEKRKIIQEALMNGQQNTVLGAVPQMKPSNKKKQPQWAMIETDLVPRGFIMN